MALTNFPNGITSFGVPVLTGSGSQVQTGNTFFVNSTGGRAGASGSTTAPISTVDGAIGAARANKGDVIYLMPGHAETIATGAGINFDVAGVKVIGTGTGNSRPTLTMSAVASTIAMNAAGSWLENVIILVEHDCTIVIDVNAADCVIKDVEFRARTATTAREWLTCIDVNGGAANACDRTRIIGCTFKTPTAGANNCIALAEVADAVEIANCWMWADCNDAPIHNPTGKVLTNLLIRDSYIANLQTGDHAIELVSACTGSLIRNFYRTDMAQTTGVDPGSCFSFECYQADVIDTSAILTPVVT